MRISFRPPQAPTQPRPRVTQDLCRRLNHKLFPATAEEKANAFKDLPKSFDYFGGFETTKGGFLLNITFPADCPLEELPSKKKELQSEITTYLRSTFSKDPQLAPFANASFKVAWQNPPFV
ncbi:MAG: hypothetical protein HY901_02055 [Deltaproteobacteria bacterium]|nr:hypothetical protein [Deltaproteobacteria bacterium]